MVKGQPSAAPKSYAQELGWASHTGPDGTVYTGHYRMPGLRYEGWIVEDNGKLTFYIKKPPIDLLRATDFAGCFHCNNDDWWVVGFKPYDMATDVASGIAAIQKTLWKAFQVRTAKRRAQI